MDKLAAFGIAPPKSAVSSQMDKLAAFGIAPPKSGTSAEAEGPPSEGRCITDSTGQPWPHVLLVTSLAQQVRCGEEEETR